MRGDVDLLNGASISAPASVSPIPARSSPGERDRSSGTITNTGTIEIHDGALTLFASLSGTSSVTADAGALLKLEGTVTLTATLDGARRRGRRSTRRVSADRLRLVRRRQDRPLTIKYGGGHHRGLRRQCRSSRPAAC